MEVDDMELLRDYARNHSDQAFRTLVERHIDFVYAVALRQTGDAQFAEDVTQAVFIVLAEKAAALPKNTILAGWLFRATRFAAANVRRTEARRAHWEEKAAQMEPLSSPEPEFDQITPLLNEALEQLPESDRAAILLRFFESKSMEEVGRTLGTTEGAAKMRLSRAVEKLRAIFRKRGVVVSAAALVVVLSAQSAQAAPIGLASSIATAALLKQSSASTLIIAKGTLKVMAQAQSKKLALAAAVLLLGGTTAVVVQQSLKTLPDGTAARDTKALAPAPTKAALPASTSLTNSAKVLVFRNVPSWKRQTDFEDRLAELGFDFEVKPSALIKATYASHGYLSGVPGDALLLATESADGESDTNKPTFIEYSCGAGRVIAACQCFHDQDRSGRGALMPTLLTYAAERKWYSPKK